MSSPRPHAAAEKPPRLVVAFVFCTALGLALGAIAITFLVRTGSTAQAQRHAIERARFAADAVLERELRPTDVRGRPAPARRRELARLFRESVLLEGIERVALYDERGRLSYTTSRGAPRALRGDAVAEALRGVVTSSLAGDVLRTEVPLVLGRTRTSGIVSFEQDYKPIAAAGRRSAWLAAVVLEGVLVALFLVLAPTLLRVTRRIRLQIAEIEHTATHDEPTGAANRVALKRAVDDAVAAGRAATLLLLDLDGFSELNEAFGPDGAEAALREVALRLRWELADCEVLARLGEDEFGLLVETDRRGDAERVAERIQECLAAPVTIDGVPVSLTASMGAAALGDGASDVTSLVRRAGIALSAAKDARDGAVRFYDPALDTRGAARELREALDDDQLVVHFQPQQDLATRRIRGVEALVRWRHPTRGLLGAGEFIHHAEQGGLAKDVRRLVLESAASCWHEWDRHGLRLELSVNLGTVDLHDALLPDEIAVLLEVWGIPPRNLVLEITERTLVVDERRAAQVIDALRMLGVRLAIDDFGTGYSSLASLQRFPVEVLKLDRSLVAAVPGEPGSEAVVRGAVDLAHALGAIVVAEGIETQDQWETVRALGCDVAQGYLVGRPAPPDELTPLLDGVPAVTPHIAAA